MHVATPKMRVLYEEERKCILLLPSYAIAEAYNKYGIAIIYACHRLDIW